MNVFKIIPLLLLAWLCSFTPADAPKLNPQTELIHWRQNGVLLVRLKTQQHRIKLLHQKGESLAAKELEYERRQYHRFLREAFRDHYNFSDVYFFFNRDAHRVFAGDYQGLLFDIDGRKVHHPPSTEMAYVLDSYFPNHPHFPHHRNEKEGFVIKKISASGISKRVSPFAPYTFFAPTHLKNPKQVRRLHKRVQELNKTLWEKFAVANLKMLEREEAIFAKRN